MSATIQASTVVEVLPYYREDTGSQITVHHLLSHTSGLPGYTRPAGVESDPARNPDETEAYVKTYCSGDLEFDPEFSTSSTAASPRSPNPRCTTS
jgi:CubicO group peptidase (beta-lactamase class C family)